MSRNTLRIVTIEAGKSAERSIPTIDGSLKPRCPMGEDVFLINDSSTYYLFAPRTRSYCSIESSLLVLLMAFDGVRTVESVLGTFGLDRAVGRDSETGVCACQAFTSSV